MPFKINISEKGKTFKIETETEFLMGKKIGEKLEGGEIKPELSGYELEITGTSDIAGFAGMRTIEGEGLKKVLLKKGFGMKKSRPKGLRLRKTLRGNMISKNTVQINLKVLKVGNKKLEEIFPKAEEKPAEKKAEVKE
ncbi:MAG: S6e family ribosomal protein [Nanoarchaeota archaeon]